MVWSLLIFAIGLVLFDLLASRFGADTRDGQDWSTHDSI
jgi:hypothetical protein